jgi:hypothetical protein
VHSPPTCTRRLGRGTDMDTCTAPAHHHMGSHPLRGPGPCHRLSAPPAVWHAQSAACRAGLARKETGSSAARRSSAADAIACSGSATPAESADKAPRASRRELDAVEPRESMLAGGSRRRGRRRASRLANRNCGWPALPRLRAKNDAVLCSTASKWTWRSLQLEGSAVARSNAWRTVGLRLSSASVRDAHDAKPSKVDVRSRSHRSRPGSQGLRDAECRPLRSSRP